MSAPLHEPAPAGSRDELREFIAEQLSFAVVHVEHGVNYATMRHDAALGYALRAASAYLNAAVDTYCDLTAKEVDHG